VLATPTHSPLTPALIRRGWGNGAILKLNYSNIKFYGQVEDAFEHPAGAELNFLHLTLDTWRPFEKGFIFILFEAAFFLHII